MKPHMRNAIPTKTKKSNAMPVVAFILSLLFFVPFAPLAAVMLAIISLVKIYDLKGFSIAALIMGILGLVGQTLIVILLLGTTFTMAPVVDTVVETQDLPVDEDIQGCTNLPVVWKDVCILVALGTHPEEKGKISKEFCEEHLTILDYKAYCLRYATGDINLCEQIQNPGIKEKCLD